MKPNASWRWPVGQKRAVPVLLLTVLLNIHCVSGGFWKKAAIAAGCATVACSAVLEVVTSGNECLVERFGKFDRHLGAGWHFVGRPFERVSFKVTTREQLLDVPPQQCFTMDNAPIKADAIVYIRIFDVERARYAVSDLSDALLNLCLTELREEVGKLTLDQTFSSRERINDALLRELNQVAKSWGVQITRVELQNLTPSPEIVSAMELQMAAERKKRASILQSEGERTTLMNEAEGRARAALTDAEAKSRSIEMLAEAEAEKTRLEAEGMKHAISVLSSVMGAKEDAIMTATQLLMFNRYMETQGRFAASTGTKVLMFPSKDSIPLTSGSLKGLMGG